jgi:hypothetical protein
MTMGTFLSDGRTSSEGSPPMQSLVGCWGARLFVEQSSTASYGVANPRAGIEGFSGVG